MKKRLRQLTVQVVRLCVFPATWIAGVAAALSPAAQESAQAQIVPTTNGAGTTVTESGGQYDIDGGTQAGGNLFHEFDEFSLDSSQTANFTSDSGVFNIVGQVSDANPSYIDGTVQVTGSDANLYLVNPSGVLFGPNVQLSLPGSFTATTADQVGFGNEWLDVTDSDSDYTQLTADPSAYRFTDTEASAVVNYGDLSVAAGESIALVGGNVVNTGSLEAPGGEIGLVAVADESTVRLAVPGSLLSLEVIEEALPTGSAFSPTDLPTLLTGSSAPLPSSLTVQGDGTVRLHSIPIELGEVSTTGTVSSAGDEATGSAFADGGAIAITGNTVDIVNATIDASGENGGLVTVGSAAALPTAHQRTETVLFNRGSEIRADGENGAGGEVAIEARDRALIRGEIDAEGTTAGGTATADADSLDFYDLTLSVAGADDGGQWRVAQTHTSIEDNGLGFNQIDSGLIETVLDAGTDVQITGRERRGSGDITLSDSIDQSGGGSATLTLTGRYFAANNGSKINMNSSGDLRFELNAVNSEPTQSSASIEAAINAIGAVEGRRVIDLGAGNYDFTSTAALYTDVEVEGAGAANTRLRVTTPGDKVFNVEFGVDAALRDVTLTTAGLSAGDVGGGVRNNGSLTVENSHFVDNRAHQNGGAIDSFGGGPLTILNSEFRGNRSASNGSGGAIHLGNTSGTSTISNTLFKNNHSFFNGGGINVSDTTLVVDGNSRFVGNTAADGGAAAISGMSQTDFNDVMFEQNVASRSGGAVTAWNGATVGFNNSTIRENEAYEFGGGLSLFEGTYTFADSAIENNLVTNSSVSGSHDGGGIRAIRSLLTLSNTTVRGNETAGNGGGLSLTGGTTTLTNRSVVSVNRSQGDGGGISANSGVVNISDVTLARNESLQSGGGISLRQSSIGNIADVRLERNQAGENGGGISHTSTNTLTIDDSRFFRNHADFSGGAIYEDSAAMLNIRTTNSLHNTAGVDGGALSVGGGGSVLLDTLSINNNTAQQDGGAIAIRDSDAVSIVSASLSQNEAINGVGGAIANSSDTGSFDIVNTSVDNNIATRGGGIYTAADSLSTITSTGLLGNEATASSGGGLYVSGDSGITLSRVGVRDNIAADQGGGLYLDSSRAALGEAVAFSGNMADSDGGAIAHNADNVTLFLHDAYLLNNITQEDGGALYASQRTNTVVTDSVFEGNRAEGTNSKGGAIAIIRSGELSLSDTEVRANFAQRTGGGLFLNDDSVASVSGSLTTDAEGLAIMATSAFEDNVANSDGGGIAVSDRSQLSVDSSLFKGNATGDDGGGIAVIDNGDATITNSNFELNQATDSGGGLYSNSSNQNAADGNRVVVEGSRFITNDAPDGGGLYAGRQSAARVNNTTFRDNRAVEGGGVRVVDDGTLLVTGSTLEDNRATRGGGLYNLGTTELVNTTLSGNIASGAGGAISTSGPEASLSVRNSTIANNRAGSLGGGIAEALSRLTYLQNTIVARNTGASADVSGRFVDGGNNLIGTAAGATGFINSTFVGSNANKINPGLAPLANNGGATRTHLLLADSLAVNTGGTTNLPTFDQRGLARTSGSAADIGSVELTAAETATISAGDVIAAQVGSPEPTLSENTFGDLDLLLANRTDHNIEVSNRVIRRMERSFSQSFEDYWDLSAGPDMTFDDVQAILRRAQEEYKVNSAVIYAVFAPEDREETDSDILRIEPTPADDDLLNLAVIMPEGELVSYELPVTRREANRQVRYFRSTVADPEDSRSYQPLSQQMYQWLLAPIEKDLAAQNIQNLMYALDDGLRTAPIAAMRDYEGFSLERYGISVVPSMGLMQADFPIPVRRSTVAMGVSEFDTQSPLPAVPIELEVVDQFVPVSQTVLNESTTLEAIKAVQALEQPGVLHLATHANFNRRSPEESSIQLWNEPLSMKAFSELGWGESDLELLVLSACSTAMSSRNAELGFAGLAAASGVDATVGSLWEVSDVGTLALMSEFYAQLEKTDLRFEALRRAQLALLNGDTRIEGGNLVSSHGEVDLPDEWNLPDAATLDHPFFWSSFTMVGNPW